jgi:mRNA-degrading endonuclease HigB of HigAB toxin-antitoxin module
MKTKPKDITRIFREGKLIDKALSKAVRDALVQHKQAGKPVVEWRDGKAVWIAPEDIKLWDEE